MFTYVLAMKITNVRSRYKYIINVAWVTVYIIRVEKIFYGTINIF